MLNRGIVDPTVANAAVRASTAGMNADPGAASFRLASARAWASLSAAASSAMSGLSLRLISASVTRRIGRLLRVGVAQCQQHRGGASGFPDLACLVDAGGIE